MAIGNTNVIYNIVLTINFDLTNNNINIGIINRYILFYFEF